MFRLINILALITIPLHGASPHPIPEYTKREAIRYILNDYCQKDCAGYLSTHSPRYRRTFIKALNGDYPALRTVFSDRLFHSGDNESWEPIPGNIFFVVGDRCFFNFASASNRENQRNALSKIPIAAPFFNAYEAGDRGYFRRNYPLTHKLYARHFPEYAKTSAND